MPPYLVTKIIFDLDGTLVHSAVDLIAAANHVMQYIGLPDLEYETARQTAGHGAIPLISLGFENADHHGNPKDYHAMFLDHYRAHYSQNSELFPNVRETLLELHAKGFELAICTNKPYGLTIPLVEALGITDLFSVIVGGDSYSKRKPDPAVLTHIINQMNSDGPTVMVGDTTSDIIPAKKLGIPAIAMRYGYSSEGAENIGADLVLDNFSDLVDLIQLP